MKVINHQVRIELSSWFRTDEIGELIDAVEHSAELARGIAANPAKWKWLVLALHSAVQGALVCALRGGDTSGTAVLANAGEVLAWLNGGCEPPHPRERLANLMDLYRRARKVSYLPTPYTFKGTSEITKDLKTLSSLRNTFVHFVPMGLSVEVGGLPRVARNCCVVIESLAVTHPTFWHQLDEVSGTRLRAAVIALRKATDEFSGSGSA